MTASAKGTREQRIHRMRAIGASALRAGDDEMARAILTVIELVTRGNVAENARPMTSTERSRARRRRIHATRGNVAGNDACSAASSIPEGDQGGGDLGISRESSGSDPKENTKIPPLVPRPLVRVDDSVEPKRKRKTSVPATDTSSDAFDGWVEHWRFAGVDGGSPDELAKFVDYHRAKGSVMADWTAAYRTWLKNAATWAKQRAANRPSWQKASTLQGHGNMSDWERYAATGTGP